MRITNGDTLGSGGGIRTAASTTLVLDDSTVESNLAVNAGGGIENATGATLTLNDTDVVTNDVSAAGGDGGGINSGGPVTIQDGSTVTGNELTGAGSSGGGVASSGSLTVLDSLMANNDAIGSGGGINQLGGNLEIARSEIFTNDATAGPGGGIALAGTTTAVSIDDSEIGDNKAGIVSSSAAGTGGGIDYNPSAGATLIVSDTTMEGNQAFVRGGGIALRNDAVLDLQRSTIKFNQVLSTNAAEVAAGGGIFDSTNTASTVADSFFLGNTTSAPAGASINSGGAIRPNGPTLITRTTFSGNSVSGGDAGSGPAGGAVGVFTGTTSLVNVTLDGNSANTVDGDGGGIDGGGGTVNLFNVTSASNSSADIGDGISEGAFGGTVAARASVLDDGCGSTITDNGDNLDAGSSCGLLAGSNTSAALGPLQNNGGAPIGSPGDPSTRTTRAIDVGSPALDKVAGNCLDQLAAPLTLDGRGLARPQDGDSNGSVNCDVGAFEKAGVAPPATTPPPCPTGQRAAALKK